MYRVKCGELRIGPEEKEALNEVTDSGWISESNPNIRIFERSWAKYIGTKDAIVVNSGTSALIAALTEKKKKYKIPSGKKIITSPLTYIATSNAIELTGFEPAFVDVDRKRFVIEPESIEELLKKDSDQYCGILPVHLMGYACDMDGINTLAKKYNLFVFEDAAQAHGTLY